MAKRWFYCIEMPVLMLARRHIPEVNPGNAGLETVPFDKKYV